MANLSSPSHGVVISQVYGGGGNSQATYKNDFIELFNASDVAVSVEGWSVQYASATGTSWQATRLSGSIAAGGYYLIKEAAGSGGTTDLPTPNATGGIAMAAGAGKVALVTNANPLTGTGCPLPAAAIGDYVGYGTAPSTGANCSEGNVAAPTLTNTTAALRKLDGTQDTDNNGADFSSGTPNPRSGGGGSTAGTFDHVAISGGTTVNVNQTITLTATLQDVASQPITDAAATYVWSSSDAAGIAITASSGSTATIKGMTIGGPVRISVSATSGGVTKVANADITVTTAPAQISLSLGTTPLVIGYQTQVFIGSGSIDKSGNPVTASNVTWASSAPDIVSVDSRGLISAAGDGTAAISVTAADGSTSSINVTTEVPIYSSSARADHNLEFGTPIDADASNDVIIARKQYTLSYNPQRGGPNWVSWNLSSTHLGTRNRCNCYTADTALVRLGYGQYMYTTLDYTNGGYDRGHMEPSADQTTTDGENATTFFLTNFLPQQHNLNAGPWENLENDLRDSVKAGREAYIIAGGIFTGGVGLGSIKNEGKIQIPDSTWKIVVLMPSNTGLANVTSATDMDVFVVNMPNVAAPLSSKWADYKTTVQKIQQSTGYDFLSALPEAIQCKVEVRNCAPTAHITGTGVSGGTEGQSLHFDAATSTDADGTVQQYQWSIDGTVVGNAAALDHLFTDNGTYQVRLVVTDNGGASDVTTSSVIVSNVAPSIGALTGGTVNEGSAFTATGSFADPGDDTWYATVDYGDGSGVQPLTLAGKSFSLAHTYINNGPRPYTVTVTVTETDAEGASGSQSTTVTVANVAPTVASFAGAMILRGETYTSSGTFSDPGADVWSAMVNYGDGSGASVLPLAGNAFALQHVYTVAGEQTVTVTVSDADGGSGTQTARVTVLSSGQGITMLTSMVSAQASSGAMEDGDAKWLANKLDVAGKELARGNNVAARNQLQQAIERIEAAQRAGRLSASDAETLTNYATRILASMA